MYGFEHIKTSLDDGQRPYRPLTYFSAGYGYNPYVLPNGVKAKCSISLPELASKRAKAHPLAIETREYSKVNAAYISKHIDKHEALLEVEEEEDEMPIIIYPEFREDIIRHNNINMLINGNIYPISDFTELPELYKEIFKPIPPDLSRIWRGESHIFTICRVCELINNDTASKYVQYHERSKAYICRECLHNKNIKL